MSVNKEHIRAAIERVTTMILENWGMMMVDSAENSLSIYNNDEPFKVAMITFKGAVSGQYQIICQPNFATALATNVLGLDETPEQADQDDALREMANVLCGNMLTECYGQDLVFDLGSPEVSAISSSELENLFNERSVCYLADEHPVTTCFNLDIPD